MLSHTIRTTLRPDVEITVDDAQYESLLEQGLIYDGTPPDPVADAFDQRIADRLAASGSATRAVMDDLYGDVADAGVAAIVADPESDTGVALRAALGAPAPTYLGGAKLAYFGDSIESYGEGYTNYATVLSSQRLRRHQRISYPGADSATLLTHITDVTAASDKAQMCLIKVGSNDAQTSVPAATYAANVIAMVDAVLAAGIAPVLATVPPVTGKVAQVQAYNLWIARYAATNRIRVVDFYTALADATTGSWQTAYDSGDGVHPSSAGMKQMGQAVVGALAADVPSVASLLPVADGGVNLLPGGLFTVDANADGIPDQWSITAGYTGTTSTRLTEVGAPGRIWRTTLASPGAVKEWNRSSISTGFAVGDRILAVARVRTGQSGTDTVASLRLDCLNSGATLVSGGSNLMTGNAGLSQQVDGVALTEFTVPAGTAFLKPYWRLGPGNGTYDLAQFGVYNLTQLGVA